jgi:hypothetical protein
VVFALGVCNFGPIWRKCTLTSEQQQRQARAREQNDEHNITTERKWPQYQVYLSSPSLFCLPDGFFILLLLIDVLSSDD